MKAQEFSVLGPLMGGFGSQAFLGCMHDVSGIRPAVFVFLPDEVVADADLFRRVWQETELAVEIDHKNVIGVMGMARLDEGFARVVDYADAESLRSVFRRATTLKKPLPPTLACAIVADACMGVHYAHELFAMEHSEPLIHGGIRPETLQVGFAGLAKVTGYGATTLAEIARKHRGSDGKDAYTAPEQAYGGRSAATAQTDVYALGCVLFEALTGKAPFAADNDLAEAMMRDELLRPPRSDEHSGETVRLKEQMASVVLRATKKHSAERFASALAMRQALLDECAPADGYALKRYMDDLFPSDTVPRATRDNLLAKARSQRPAVTGRLLTTPPPDRMPPTRERVRVPSDVEVEASHGNRVIAPPSHLAETTLPPISLPPELRAQLAALPPPTDEAETTAPSGLNPRYAAAQMPVARSTPRSTPPSTPPVPAPIASPMLPALAPEVSHPSLRSGAGRLRAPEEFQQTAAPVVYKAPPSLLIGLGLAAGVAVALVTVLVLKSTQPPAVVVQAPPAPVPTPVEQVPTAPVTPPPVAVPAVVAAAPVVPPAPAPPVEKRPTLDPNTPGTLAITTEPASLSISVNGQPQGTGTATFTGKAGSYSVVAKDAALGVTVKKTVKLKPGQHLDVFLEAQRARLSFDQLPDGVDVVVDGKKIGKTPLPVLELFAGPHRVKVKKNGAEIPYDIDIPAGREMFLTATFDG